MTVDTPDTAVPSRLRAATLHRVAGLCGLAYVTLLVLNIVVTTTGPLPNGSISAEAARVAAEGIEVRWSALLGLCSTAAFGGFVVGLTLIAVHRGRPAAAAVMAAGGLVHCAVWMVSFAALAAAAQAAQTGLTADATMAMGQLHSTALLLGFAPAGAVLLASAASGIWRRVGTVAALVVGVAALVAPACSASTWTWAARRCPRRGVLGHSGMGRGRGHHTAPTPPTGRTGRRHGRSAAPDNLTRARRSSTLAQPRRMGLEECGSPALHSLSDGRSRVFGSISGHSGSEVGMVDVRMSASTSSTGPGSATARSGHAGLATSDPARRGEWPLSSCWSRPGR